MENLAFELPKNQTFVPRHKRFSNFGIPVIVKSFVEVPVPVNVVDSNGEIVYQECKYNYIPASESLAKYKVEDFKLSHLLSAGVPLDVVNINRDLSFELPVISQAIQSMDDAKKFAVFAENQRQQFKDLFGDGVASVNNDNV